MWKWQEKATCAQNWVTANSFLWCLSHQQSCYLYCPTYHLCTTLSYITMTAFNNHSTTPAFRAHPLITSSRYSIRCLFQYLQKHYSFFPSFLCFIYICLMIKQDCLHPTGVERSQIKVCKVSNLWKLLSKIFRIKLLSSMQQLARNWFKCNKPFQCYRAGTTWQAGPRCAQHAHDAPPPRDTSSVSFVRCILLSRELPPLVGCLLGSATASLHVY